MNHLPIYGQSLQSAKQQRTSPILSTDRGGGAKVVFEKRPGEIGS